MQNETGSKWKLFITSYLPLYLWILLSEIDYHHLFHSIANGNFKFKHFGIRFVLVVMIATSLYTIWKLFKFDGEEASELPLDMQIEPESDSLMNYIVTYFTPLLSFNMNDTKSIIMNVLLFLLTGLMYVGSNASYLNPVLGIFGFKIFAVTGFPNAHHLISNMSFDELETAKRRKDKIIRYRLGDGIYIIKRDTNGKLGI